MIRFESCHTTVFGSKIKVDLDLSLLRLILTVIPVCHVGSFCNTYFFIFGLVLIHIRFFIFISRYLGSNEITQLPENVFSGLSELEYLYVC